MSEIICVHKNTVHGELKGLTHFELCIDCGMSRSEDEQVTGGWMRNEHACKNVARQWRKLQGDKEQQIRDLKGWIVKIKQQIELCNGQTALNMCVEALKAEPKARSVAAAPGGSERQADKEPR